ncbi:MULTISPECIES: sensor histidine kinase KdpD [unclassified Vibrio]|uniref:sensor histidine kinase n=1 Tax=unclassified Vibrio TaxID=2614977 RepID=UPI000C819171|nr:MULTISPECIES: HAMP domain-containing sensor histidine kinase [unclassified Vibrio]PMI97866.1 hypothetical protein BCU34_17435 [Vibrio sp. 10N.286.45.E10]PTQ23664.1 two-component sensor histidine kinase [Vibrio sp. 10N.286.46.E10]
MKTFVIQIISSLLLGFIASNLFSVIFLSSYREELENQANRHRVEMVVDGFLADKRTSSSAEPVWSLQCHADNVKPTLINADDDSEVFSLTVDYHEGKLSAVFNEDAFHHEPINRKLYWLSLFEGIIQVVFSVTILLYNLRTWTNNIQSLHWLSTQYAKGDFLAKIEVDGPIEVATLIQNQLNMAREIRSSITQQKLVFASLPHDIRTPLSAIQLTCDMLVEERKSTPFLLERLDTQVNSLNRLCESSLHLLKVFNRDLALERQQVNFQEILTSVVESLDKKMCVTYTGTNKLIHTDVKLVTTLLLNILSNACRYAESSVHIRFQSYPRFDIVRIINDGPKYDKKLVERFNNGLLNMDGLTKDGFGFGLILIHELVKYLNGTALINHNTNGAEMVLIMKL